MKYKDFLEADDFYTLTNDAKLAYFYFDAYKDNDGFVYCSELIMATLNVDSSPILELQEIGLIKIDEDTGIIKVKKR
ncbi:septum site-determining protein MinC [Limosilactobacillus coleohominis]|uniref:septum site-determining protein MinC n=1 Tax=Limosilactobacillus coleohominis TaxID=181675 RepID=UPI002A90D55F|nr:septum site-determining protein MinC [Limosilactobacillus coleohominis]MDY5628902.1 septum site-determining protein MinC [Limosilactobacillus coleohominis]